MKKPTVREIIDQNHFDTIYEPIVVVENTQIFRIRVTHPLKNRSLECD